MHGGGFAARYMFLAMAVAHGWCAVGRVNCACKFMYGRGVWAWMDSGWTAAKHPLPSPFPPLDGLLPCIMALLKVHAVDGVLLLPLWVPSLGCLFKNSSSFAMFVNAMMAAVADPAGD